MPQRSQSSALQNPFFAGGEGWIRTSVLVRGQIYSLLPLTTRPPLQDEPRSIAGKISRSGPVGLPADSLGARALRLPDVSDGLGDGLNRFDAHSNAFRSLVDRRLSGR